MAHQSTRSPPPPAFAYGWKIPTWHTSCLFFSLCRLIDFKLWICFFRYHTRKTTSANEMTPNSRKLYTKYSNILAAVYLILAQSILHWNNLQPICYIAAKICKLATINTKKINIGVYMYRCATTNDSYLVLTDGFVNNGVVWRLSIKFWMTLASQTVVLKIFWRFL